MFCNSRMKGGKVELGPLLGYVLLDVSYVSLSNNIYLDKSIINHLVFNCTCITPISLASFFFKACVPHGERYGMLAESPFGAQIGDPILTHHKKVYF